MNLCTEKVKKLFISDLQDLGQSVRWACGVPIRREDCSRQDYLQKEPL